MKLFKDHLILWDLQLYFPVKQVVLVPDNHVSFWMLLWASWSFLLAIWNSCQISLFLECMYRLVYFYIGKRCSESGRGLSPHSQTGIELLVKYNHHFLRIEKQLSLVFNPINYLYIYVWYMYLLYLLGVFSLGRTKLFET